MSYIDKVLQPGETILYRTTLSWTLLLPGAAVLLIAVLAYGFSSAEQFPSAWSIALLAIIGIPGVYLLAQAWFSRWITEIAVTSKRIILKRGFIRRHTIEMNMDKVESVDVDQSLFGRLFNYGDVTVRGVGTGFEPLRMVDDPLRFRSQVSTG